jgi:hypothetical protein
LLSTFIGMLTDSRSFMSYPRHEYFRRVLCNLLGQEIEAGQIPEDEGLVGKLISRICYDNAVKYLGLPFAEAAEKAAADAVGVSAGRDGAARKDGHSRQTRN